ncbi:hypothetical protein IWX90DRAFT_489890 [Phyllosticta citrichinensis]|uniref:DUF1682-domain-containing protein n=1 Tax=Phyllosticta citrichinensis TaxID=1130410 RepID=A0ABR1XIK9_9PEZI
MADFLNNLLGTKPKPSPAPVADHDADFADFASAPEPTPASISVASASTAAAGVVAGATDAPRVPYTKWYRVWERTQLSDFKQEAFILPFILLVVLVHVWGTRANRRRAHGWARAHAPALKSEFASVGFGGRRDKKPPTVEEVQASGLARLSAEDMASIEPEKLVKEVAHNEYQSYATGRQNIAFVDVKLSMFKRYNPLVRYGEAAASFFFDSVSAPVERMEATAYTFDGKESTLAPGAAKVPNSTFDGFVFAIVHKDLMKRLRDDRYDLSLTTTKDHPKLPMWYTVMSESAEITDAMLTPELLKVVEQAGDALEALVISDQPMDRPKKLDETNPRKRVTLSLTLPSNGDYSATLPLFSFFLRLPDQLASSAHFRPEALRRVRQTREDEVRKLRKLDDEGRAEERRLEAEKQKKADRERKLKNMSADDQRKYLEKEREKNLRRSQRQKTMKG